MLAARASTLFLVKVGVVDSTTNQVRAGIRNVAPYPSGDRSSVRGTALRELSIGRPASLPWEAPPDRERTDGCHSGSDGA